MSALKQLWIAAAFGLLIGGDARAQQPGNQPPLRAVYVTGQDGNSKVYYVTGTVPPEKMPTVVPAAPVVAPPVARVQSKVVPVRRDVPAQLPAVAPAPPVEAAPVVSEANCTTKHCGPRCKHGATSCWECAHTPATVPAPLGASVRSVFDMQRDNALAEYFVIYREDWLASKFVLNETGQRHIDGVIRRLGMIGASVKVEPTGIAELDQKRVTAIVERLVQAGIPASEAGSRVVLGTTRAEGLRDGDIERINGRANSLRGGGGGSGYGSFNSFGGFGGGIGGFGFR